MSAKRRIIQLLVIVCVISGFASLAQAEKASDIEMLVLPIVPGPNVDIDLLEEIDDVFATEMKRGAPFKISRYSDYEKDVGRKRARRVLQCMDDIQCIDRSLRRSNYRLFVVGKAEVTGEKWRVVEFTIFNLDQGEVKRTKKLRYKKETFTKKRGAKWVRRLMDNPEELYEAGAAAVAEPEPPKRERRRAPAVAPTPAPAPVPAAPTYASPEDVRGGVRTAYELYVAADIDGAIRKINAVYDDPCRCDADRETATMRAMLNEFKTLYVKANTQLDAKRPDNALDTLSQLDAMMKNLADEGKKLKIDNESKYTAQVSTMYAKAHLIMGEALVRRFEYVKARDHFAKALGYDSSLSEAKQEMDKMATVYANKLFSRAQIEAITDPEMAIGFLKQVVELAGEDSDLGQQALDKIEELEEE